MPLTVYNKISIIDLVFFVPILAVAVLLCFRHGFGRSFSWIYIILLALMRIVGASMQLATIAQPTNLGIIIGAQTLQSTGLSPLILILLGLLMRAQSAIPEGSRPFLPNRRTLRLIQLVVLVGLILIIVGGIKLGSEIGNALDSSTAFAYKIPTVSQAGVALIIVSFAAIMLSAAFLITYVPKGEKRLLLAIFAAMPFVLVRLVYSSMAMFNPSNKHFHQFNGSTDAGYYNLGMCAVMEIVSVVIVEAVGLTLPYTTRSSRAGRNTDSASGQPLNTYSTQEDASSRLQSFPQTASRST